MRARRPESPASSQRRSPRLLADGVEARVRVTASQLLASDVALTVVIEQTVDPTSWLIVTGWSSTAVERNLLEAR
jgi:hypothetical protein